MVKDVSKVAYKPPVTKNVIIWLGFFENPVDVRFLKLDEGPLWDVRLIGEYIMLVAIGRI